MFFSICFFFCLFFCLFLFCFLIQAHSPWLTTGTMSYSDWSSVCVSVKQEILMTWNQKHYKNVFADRHWRLPHARDTGIESGTFERESEAAVVTVMSITEGLDMIDLHMSAVGLSVMATAIHPTVRVVPHLSRCFVFNFSVTEIFLSSII